MYHLLIVDDEPLICKGLQSLLMSAGMAISSIHLAHSGAEALDYLRVEEIDLLITDIQMGEISGIDLMYHAKMIHPHIQTIVISAHDKFQYAQQAIRLGAKDYIVKPINNHQLLDSVRNVLLKMDKAAPQDNPYISKLKEHFAMTEPEQELTASLNGYLRREQPLTERLITRLTGPYYAVMKIKLRVRPDRLKERGVSAEDTQLFRYASLNIVQEMLDQELDHLTVYSPDDELTIIIQWSELAYSQRPANKIDYLELIGRSLHSSIERYLNIECSIGFSQILRGVEYLPDLHDQALKAIHWNRVHYDNHVFYYGDLNWSIYGEDPTAEEIFAQNNSIVEKVKEFLEANYHQKGLTLHEVAQKNHVSPNYLSYLFKKFTGCGLWEYVIKLRMEESKRLILTTDLRRYEIADRVGYESPEHFSKIFKKYFGFSPSDLKK
jgi:YesN/AraC family two-component response regulator